MRPPRLHAAVLRMLGGRDAEFLLGDLEEEWARMRAVDGPAAADAWYRRQVRASALACIGRHRRGIAERWIRDVRIAVRALRRSPGYTGTAVATLALGLGGAATVATLARSALRPLPYPAPDRLVAVWEQRDGQRRSVAPANYLDWRRVARSFEGLAAVDVRDVSVTVGGAAERARVAVASGNLFQVLGVPAEVGRTFDPTFDPAFPGLEAVLSHAAWQTAFGASPDVVGATFQVDEITYRVVGVAPAHVDSPEPDLFAWVRSRVEAPEIAGFPSLDALREMRDAWYFGVVGRLREGVDIAVARQEMADIARGLEATYPESNTGHTAVLTPLRDERVSGHGATLLALGLAATLILLAAGVNVVHLVWARAAVRTGESAMRRALGATRGDLLRPFVAEGAVLGTAGAAGGLTLTALAVTLGSELMDSTLTDGVRVFLDPGVSVGIVLVGALAGMAVGAVGFLRGGAPADVSRVLREPRHGARRLGHGMVSAQVAAAVALLGAAGLLGRTVLNLAAVDPGFESRDLITLRVALPDARARAYAERVDVFRSVAETVEALPGVTAVGFGSTTPLSMGPRAGAFLVGSGDEDPVDAGWQPVSPGYFTAVGMTLLRGRTFDEGDVPGSREVAVVNEAFVRDVLRSTEPLGRRVTMGLDGHDTPLEIVGVVADTRTRGPARAPGAVLYRPVTQTRRFSADAVFLAVRGPARRVTPGAVRDAVRAVAPGLPLYDLRPGPELMRPFRGTQQALFSILAVFAATTLLLGTVGVYGVAAASVERRKRELGVRLALGADPRRLVGSILGRGLRHALLGLPLGTALAYLLGRALAGVLFGVTALDPAVLAAAWILVTSVASCALLIPAASAARTDPAAATRAE